jgi:hypothetical protein
LQPPDLLADEVAALNPQTQTLLLLLLLLLAQHQ